MEKQIKIFVENSEKFVLASQSRPLIEALSNAGIRIDNSCGGSGTCGTCRVIITKGLEGVSTRNWVEEEFATERGFSANERLSCQTEAFGDISIKIP